MSGPITWRNVDSPGFSRVTSNGMNAAAELFNRAIANIQKPLDQMEATNDKNWVAQKDANTNAMAQKILSYTDPAKYQAALDSGEISGQLGGMGAQVDSSKILQLMDGRLSSLQDRQMKSDAFGDAARERAERPQAEAVRALVSQGLTKEATAAAQAYMDAGMLNPKTMTSILDAAYARSTADTKLAQEATKLEDTLKNSEAQRKHLVNADRNAAAQTAVSAGNAEVQRIRAMADLALNTGNLANKSKHETDAVLSKLSETAGKFEKGSPYGGGAYGKTDTEEFIKFGKSLGLAPDAVVGFLADIKKNYPSDGVKLPGTSLTVPLTKGMVEDAMVRGADKYGLGLDWIKQSRLNGSLEEFIAAPGFLEGYRSYLEKTDGFSNERKAVENGLKQQMADLYNAQAPYIDALANRGAPLPKR